MYLMSECGPDTPCKHGKYVLGDIPQLLKGLACFEKYLRDNEHIQCPPFGFENIFVFGH